MPTCKSTPREGKKRIGNDESIVALKIASSQSKTQGTSGGTINWSKLTKNVK